jgi:hypothetical protein
MEARRAHFRDEMERLRPRGGRRLGRAGPGLVWGLAHIVLGSLLLHGGLIAMALLIWRDPAAIARLSEIIARRRAAPRARS